MIKHRFMRALGLAAVLITPPVSAQSLQWARSFSTPDSWITTASITPGGELLMGGQFRRTITFEADALNPTSVTLTTSSSAGFLAKFDPLGRRVWGGLVANNRTVNPMAIQSLKNGETLFAGYYNKTANVKLDGLHPYEIQDPVPSTGGMFLAKLTPQGEVAWLRGNDDVDPTALARSEDGDIWVGGRLGSGNLFGPGHIFLYPASQSGFLARYHATGELSWVRSILMNEATIPTVLPTYNQTATFYVQGLSTSRIHRYDRYGELLWTQIKVGSVTSMVPGPDEGFYTVGSFKETIVLGLDSDDRTTLTAPSGQSRGYVARYDRNGRISWARAMEPAALRAAELLDGGLLVAGLYSGPTTLFAGQTDQHELPATGGNLFFARFAPNGQLMWVHLGGGDWYRVQRIGVINELVWVVGNFNSPMTLASEQGKSVRLTPLSNSSDLALAQYRMPLTSAAAEWSLFE